jgi:osmotically-inducible protein OsmY
MRSLYLPLAVVSLSILLSGCVPMVATGVGVAAMSYQDRRTTGTQVEDKTIETKIANKVSERYGSDTHVESTSFDRTVLLTGQVRDEAARRDIEQMARATDNVKNVYNELTIGPAVSSSTHANDSYITSKVKSRFVDAGKLYPGYVTVTTENSVVYLMGMVKRTEADAAAEVASTTSGVQKVVRVFEYLD